MKLIGDLGGTKVLLAWLDEAGRIHGHRRFSSSAFSSFDAVLAAFLDAADCATSLTGAALVVAGPVTEAGRRARITNLPWQLDAAALEKKFSLGHLTLANDFVGVALGASIADPAQCLTLQAGNPTPDGVRLVLGAGTGMGMAILCDGRVLPSEGGHIAFAPLDALQQRVEAVLQAEYGRVTVERVVSGPGLSHIHRILADERRDPADIVMRMRQNDDAARQSVAVFLSAYGAFAGDMALATLARGGVFLAGGVTQHLLPELPDSGFLAAFNAKAEHASLVEHIPVWVLTDPEIGLHGAARLAKEGMIAG